jgi:serine/threonine protein kinase/WD40 repeat protein
MNPESDPVEALFAAALEKPAAERDAFLQDACRGDAALHERVGALLKAHVAAGGERFLTGPYQGAATAPPLAEGPGSRLGPYKLLQRIGEGGMGVVYMAEQEQPVRRRVAFKIIKPGMDSGQVIARFEAERQALAMMDHQNIARVLDAGATPSGRPYFVMELVHGIPITQFCDQQHLSPRQRLELFIPVCQAIQHAHQKGIIHRDVKPSNVLVTIYDDKPVPKVIDFGVAKAIEQRLTEKTLFTQYGTLVGTFEYMSPEQAEMNALGVDTRSDIYSLGVLLYELLTGTTPLERNRLRQATLDEVIRLIREEEPPRPSLRLSSVGDLPKVAAARQTEPGRLAALLRGELDWIVMRCLEKDRTRRYATASGVARDAERYLHDEPVEACPPSAAYRLRKFARKNRAVLATVTAFVGLLVFAATISSWLAVQQRQAAAEADTKRQQADQARQEADVLRIQASELAVQATAKTAEAQRALDRITVAKGIELAEQGNLFEALLWFAKPLEHENLTEEEKRIHRIRIACYLRYTPERPRLLHMFFHDGSVEHTAFSADARRLLTVSGNTVHVWDLRNGKPITALRHPTKVSKAQFTADGTTVVAIAGPMVWTGDAYTGRARRFPLIHGEMLADQLPLALPLSPWQALGALGMKEMYDAEFGAQGESAFSQDSRWALIDSGWQVQLFDVEKEKLLSAWNSTRFKEGEYSLSPNSRCVLLRSFIDGPQRSDGWWVYDADTGTHVWPKTEGKLTFFDSLVFSPDGQRVLSLMDRKPTDRSEPAGGFACVRDARTGKPISPTWSYNGLVAFGQGVGFFGARPNIVAIWSHQGNIQWWDTDANKPIRSVPIRHSPKFALRPDFGQVMTTEKNDSRVKLWNLQSGQSEGPTLTHSTPYSTGSYSPDAKLLALAGEDGVVRVWCVACDTESQAISDPPKDSSPSALDCHVVINEMQGIRGIGSWSKVESLPIDTLRERGQIFTRLKELSRMEDKQPDYARRRLVVAISRDGRHVITTYGPPGGWTSAGSLTEPQAQLWDIASGDPVGPPLLHQANLLHVEFSPDSRFVVTTSMDGTAQLWDAESGRSIGAPMRHDPLRYIHIPDWYNRGPLTFPYWVNHATFSPDSTLVVTCGGDHTARVWQTATAKPVGNPLVHSGTVNRAVFSPDGRRIATACADGITRIWDTTSGAPLGTLRQSESVEDLKFGRNGLLLITVVWGNKVRIWDTSTLQQLSPADTFTERTGSSYRFSADGRLVLNDKTAKAFDISPTNLADADLVKLAQVDSGYRLDGAGGLLPLTKEETQAMWLELYAKYPQEFALNHEALLEWRVGRLNALSVDSIESVAFHRRCLARELDESNWHPTHVPDNDIRSFLQRLYAMAQFGHRDEAIAAADDLAVRSPKEGWIVYSCACVFGLAAAADKGDANRADQYAARAVVLLRRAVDAGYKNPEWMRNDLDLESLRRRDDFQTLLKGLEKSPK